MARRRTRSTASATTTAATAAAAASSSPSMLLLVVPFLLVISSPTTRHVAAASGSSCGGISASSSRSLPTPCFASPRNNRRRRPGTRLPYIRYDGIDEDEDDRQPPKPPPSSSSSSSSNSSGSGAPAAPHRQVIPLIGPIPNAPPLLVGGEYKLDPPTPMQWKALEEAVVVHRNFMSQQDNNDAANQQGGGGAIDAAPLVAFLDKVSGTAPVPGSKSSGRYATLAAVVGITSKRSPRTEDASRPRTDDEESFFDSMIEGGSSGGGIDPLSSTVRLVGVGRAVVSDLFYTVPTRLREGDDEAAAYGEKGVDIEMINPEDWEDDDDDGDDWDEDDDGYVDKTPIVMACFAALTDRAVDLTANPDAVGAALPTGRSVWSSPVHAVNELNQMSHKVNWMHDDRRRLVNGLTAAKARLALRKERDAEEVKAASSLASPASSRAEEDEWEWDLEYDDYDGLGLIGSSQSTDYSAQPSESGEEDDDTQEGGMPMAEFLERFQGTAGARSEDPLVELARAEKRRAAADKLGKLENYGLNYYGCFRSIPDLTAVALRFFEPYYSESHRSREEHALEVGSFVAFRALEGYAAPSDIAWALRCTSTVERLRRAYDIMHDHRIQLERLAEEISEELLDCGEECTDLW